MATLLIRNLSERTKSRLRVRAARKGHSMEREAREILTHAVTKRKPKPARRAADEEIHWVDRIRAFVDKYGGIDIPAIPREPMREPIRFE